MTGTNPKYAAAAKTAYATLEPGFLQNIGTNSDAYRYWQMGHAYDTMLDYYTQIDASRAAFVMGQVASNYPGYGADGAAAAGYWYDDYGWWGIAALKASQSFFVGQNQSFFRNLAKSNWEVMNKHALAGWSACTDETLKLRYPPLFPDGAWNHVLDAGDNPGNGGGNGLAGRQNTVTNGLYTVLTSRLELAKILPAYASDPPFNFLQSWLQYDEGGEFCLFRSRGVVRERVGKFKNPLWKDVAYLPDLAWAGDQGLILGVMLDRMALRRDGAKFSPLDAASDILRGVAPYMMDPATKTMLPWANGAGNKGTAPGDDDIDYLTGPGVFFRYLLCILNQGALIPKVQGSATLQQMLRATADAAIANSPPKVLSDQVNNLAVLVAAAKLTG